MTGCRDVFVGGAYLRVAVREDQLVVDGHRFPLRQRLNQKLLFNLRGNPHRLMLLTVTDNWPDTVKYGVAQKQIRYL